MQVGQNPFRCLEPDKAAAWIIEIHDRVDRQRHRDRKNSAMNEMARAVSRHACSRKQGAKQRDAEKQEKN